MDKWTGGGGGGGDYTSKPGISAWPALPPASLLTVDFSILADQLNPTRIINQYSLVSPVGQKVFNTYISISHVTIYARHTINPCYCNHRFLLYFLCKGERTDQQSLCSSGKERETERKEYWKCKVIIGTIKNTVSSKWSIQSDDSAVLGSYHEPAVVGWQSTSLMARETALKVRAEPTLRFWLGNFKKKSLFRLHSCFAVSALFWSWEMLMENMMQGLAYHDFNKSDYHHYI